MPTRGRHQSTSKECLAVLKKIEALEGVTGTIIGRSYGGKSLGRTNRTGSVRIQRRQPGGIKAVMQSAKGLQELFILVDPSYINRVEGAIQDME